MLGVIRPWTLREKAMPCHLKIKLELKLEDLASVVSFILPDLPEPGA